MERSGESFCSDCVVVLHRVGEGLALKRTANITSFSQSRSNVSLWSELDCGVFYRQSKNWQACSKWIDETQIALDDAASGFDSFHYPNVPNLATKNWEYAYYSSKTYIKSV